MNRSFALLLVLPLWSAGSTVFSASPSLLVVLRPTGQERDGLPVLEYHPDAESVRDTLLRGFSGRLVRLYAREQEFLRQKTGRVPEPAYLVLSDQQGGYPRFGFWLGGEKKPDVGWVDLHRNSRVTGEFGAMDQIFPHELLHVIVRQLAGPPRESGGNQVHAVGVRTDPVTAFNEGLAEHVQILAVDDVDAADDTQTLAIDDELPGRAQKELGRYARDLHARFLPTRPSQMRFLLWFSSCEQVLRYHAVKANAFARRSSAPDRLLARADRYEAYLHENIIPATSGQQPKPAAVMLSTEGVVSHLFWRWVTDHALGARQRDESFYAQFGAQRASITSWENVYLKLFYALHSARPGDVAEFVRGYVSEFPEDALDVDRVVSAALLGQPLPAAPEIWLANPALQTGTSLFDQFRVLPRTHTFDVNAATPLDWLAVPGVTPELAAQLISGGPYEQLDELLALPQVDAPFRERVAQMAAGMEQLRAADAEESIDLSTIFRSYLWRLAALLGVATVVGMGLARRAGAARWWTAALIALAASLLVVALAWVITCPPWYPLAAPILVGGLPWALWRLVRRRTWSEVFESLTVWIAAMIPAMILTRAGW